MMTIRCQAHPRDTIENMPQLKSIIILLVDNLWSQTICTSLGKTVLCRFVFLSMTPSLNALPSLLSKSLFYIPDI